MIVLGIESSCDETGAAVVGSDGRVHSDVVASQIEDHAPYGGVVPELAARQHLQNIVPTIDRAVDEAGFRIEELDGIAVTAGPGLVGALLVGIQFAKSVSMFHGLPLIGVDHLEAHLLAVYLKREPEHEVPTFPWIGLLVSGGHTSLYKVSAADQLELLSTTRDDAAGEAYDKTGKLLGLPYPGGPVIDALAAQGNPKAVVLPVPMKGRPGLDFSFSGLKTAVAQYVGRHGVPAREAELADLCASFQRCVVESLLARAFRACEIHEIDQLVLCGGVAANRGLRQTAQEQGGRSGIRVSWPDPKNCTDNAAMVAYLGALRRGTGASDPTALEPYSRAFGFRKGKIRRHPV